MMNRMGNRDSGGRGGRSGGPRGRSYSGGVQGSRSQGYGQQNQEGKPRFFRKKVCRLCAERVVFVDFKDTEKLLKFLTEKGKILPQRISGNCAKHQRVICQAVKRARHSALIAFQIGV